MTGFGVRSMRANKRPANQGVAQSGRASALGAEYCRFKSCHLDQESVDSRSLKNWVLVWGGSSIGRASDLHSEGCGFDPRLLLF